jgi:hypothetical protein
MIHAARRLRGYPADSTLGIRPACVFPGHRLRHVKPAKYLVPTMLPETCPFRRYPALQSLDAWPNNRLAHIERTRHALRARQNSRLGRRGKRAHLERARHGLMRPAKAMTWAASTSNKVAPVERVTTELGCLERFRSRNECGRRSIVPAFPTGLVTPIRTMTA